MRWQAVLLNLAEYLVKANTGRDELAKEKASRIEQYKMLREGHHHEWTILAVRVATYLASQSLLASGVAITYVKWQEKPEWRQAVLLLSVVGLCLTFLSSISITINLRVIRDWLRLITEFLER